MSDPRSPFVLWLLRQERGSPLNPAGFAVARTGTSPDGREAPASHVHDSLEAAGSGDSDVHDTTNREGNPT
jgi:hypothetical protein